MYPNLNAEMARHDIGTKQISVVLGKTLEITRNKLSGRSNLTTLEAGAIRDEFFPNMTIDYLFCLKPLTEGE
jgi:hypothetical protein